MDEEEIKTDPQGVDYKAKYEEAMKSLEKIQGELKEANDLLSTTTPKAVEGDNMRQMLRSFVGIHDSEG